MRSPFLALLSLLCLTPACGERSILGGSGNDEEDTHQLKIHLVNPTNLLTFELSLGGAVAPKESFTREVNGGEKLDLQAHGTATAKLCEDKGCSKELEVPHKVSTDQLELWVVIAAKTPDTLTPAPSGPTNNGPKSIEEIDTAVLCPGGQITNQGVGKFTYGFSEYRTIPPGERLVFCVIMGPPHLPQGYEPNHVEFDAYDATTKGCKTAQVTVKHLNQDRNTTEFERVSFYNSKRVMQEGSLVRVLDGPPLSGIYLFEVLNHRDECHEALPSRHSFKISWGGNRLIE